MMEIDSDSNLDKKTLGRAVKSTAMPDLKQAFSTKLLAKTITAKRTGMKLKLSDVCCALSISKPTLIKIEKGDVNVKFDNVLKVMDFLGLSFSILTDSSTINESDNGDSDVEWF